MASRSVRIRLADSREEIAGIRELTKNADLDSFARSWAMKRAVEHALLIISEAAKHLPPSMKEAHPEVPWQKLHALGNLLRHAYRRIDPEILWSIVSDHLSALDQTVLTLLNEPEGSLLKFCWLGLAGARSACVETRAQVRFASRSAGFENFVCFGYCVCGFHA